MEQIIFIISLIFVLVYVVTNKEEYQQEIKSLREREDYKREKDKRMVEIEKQQRLEIRKEIEEEKKQRESDYKVALSFKKNLKEVYKREVGDFDFYIEQVTFKKGRIFVCITYRSYMILIVQEQVLSEAIKEVVKEVIEKILRKKKKIDLQYYRGVDLEGK